MFIVSVKKLTEKKNRAFQCISNSYFHFRAFRAPIKEDVQEMHRKASLHPYTRRWTSIVLHNFVEWLLASGRPSRCAKLRADAR